MRILPLFTTVLLSLSALTSSIPQTVPLAPFLGKIQYGNHLYVLKVSESELKNGPMTSAYDVPGGVLWMTPPGAPDYSDHPMKGWRIWFTPDYTPSGSLWHNARLLRVLPVATSWNISDVTGSWVVVDYSRKYGTPLGQYLLNWKHNVWINANRMSKSISTFAKGLFAWVHNDTLTVWDPASGSMRQFHVPNALAPLNSVQGLHFVTHGIHYLDKTYTVPFVPNFPVSTLAPHFKWVIWPNGHTKVMAVPTSWVVSWQPGGSSNGFRAYNPKNPAEHVSFWYNACAGCSLPTAAGVLNGGGAAFLGTPKGESAKWVTDHLIQYTNLTGVNDRKYPSLEYVSTYQTSGNTQITVTAPHQDLKVENEIVQSFIHLLPEGGGLLQN